MKLIIRLRAGRQLLTTLNCSWFNRPGYSLQGPQIPDEFQPIPRLGEFVDVAGYGLARVNDVTYSYMKDPNLRNDERFLTVVTVDARLI